MRRKLCPYEVYKRDVGPFVYWVLQQSKAIIQSLPPSFTDAPQVDLSKLRIAPEDLISCCVFIGRSVPKDDIPDFVLALLESLIIASAAFPDTFARIATYRPRQDVKHISSCIISVNQALNVCAGCLHCPELSMFGYKSRLSDYLELCLPLTKEKLDSSIIKDFVSLEFPGDPEVDQELRLKRLQQVKCRDGRQRRQLKATDTENRRHIDMYQKEPLERFGISLGENGMEDTSTEYIIAASELFKQWVELRAYLQGAWHQVAYEGLNMAVAGALSNIAMLEMERSQNKILAGFADDKRSYLSVMTAMSPILGFNVTAEVTAANKQDSHLVNAKEMSLVFAYFDLLAFMLDYMEHNNGKPTKEMMKEIDDWDPLFDLRRATMEERIKWRRLYTITWLYHLMGSIKEDGTIDHQTTTKNQVQAENPLRGLVAIQDLVTLIKRLARAKTNFWKSILPVHVFRLQCIVDSLAVARGWSFDLLKGHVLIEPPHFAEFVPNRDVYRFLHGDGKRTGFLQGFQSLGDKLELIDSPTKKDVRISLEMDTMFNGKSPIIMGHKSLFLDTVQNVVWHLSPFLCGVGLEDALDFQFTFMMYVWSRHREFVILMHLYNMVLSEGYLDKRIDLFENLQLLFVDGGLLDRKIPKSDYGIKLSEQLKRLSVFTGTSNNGELFRIPMIGSAKPYWAASPQESFLVLLHDKSWNLLGIPKTEFPLFSLCAKFAIAQTTQIDDVISARRRLFGTPLVKRARQALLDDGLDGDLAEEKLLGMADGLEHVTGAKKRQYEGSSDMLVERNTLVLSMSEWLDIVKVDLISDIDGARPFCGLNLAQLTSDILDMVGSIEEKLCAGGAGHLKSGGTRERFFVGGMHIKDAELLQVAARTLKDSAKSLSDYYYWDTLKYGPGAATGLSSKMNSPEEKDGGEGTAADISSCALVGDEKENNEDECMVVKCIVLNDGTVWVSAKDDETTTTDANALILKRVEEEDLKIHIRDYMFVKGVILSTNVVWVATNHDETITYPETLYLKQFEEKYAEINENRCIVVKGVVLHDGTVWVKKKDDAGTTTAADAGSSFALEPLMKGGVKVHYKRSSIVECGLGRIKFALDTAKRAKSLTDDSLGQDER